MTISMLILCCSSSTEARPGNPGADEGISHNLGTLKWPDNWKIISASEHKDGAVVVIFSHD
jgi:hypothetical protein